MAGGRKSRSSGPVAPATTLVLDNGGDTIKAGFVGGVEMKDEGSGSSNNESHDAPRVIPNCVARDRQRRTYVGSELERCVDFSEMAFRRPVEKGFIVSWEAQKEIWDREFIDSGAAQRCDPAETRLVLAEQPGALPALQAHCDQMVFEEYGFASYYRGIGPAFNAYRDVQGILRTQKEESPPTVPAEVVLVVDSGYSCTTVTPVVQGRPLHGAVRRLDAGGKLLTNSLARLLSLRHFDMRGETHVVREMKEAACYVSLDFGGDLDKTWKGTRGERRADYLTGAGIARDYVLPDSHTRFHGELRDYDPAAARARRTGTAGGTAAEDIITLRNERFAVPEILFSPADVGLRQPGVADLVVQSLSALPLGLWPGLLANVVAVGGNALLEGFVQRLQAEVLRRVPDDCVVRVARPADPVASTWRGAAAFARHEHADRLAVTKQQYDEYGAAWVAREFASGLGVE